MSAAAPAIPFEAQSDPSTRRDCGAACLRMVYRSFHTDVSHDEIWHAVAGKNPWGAISSMSHLMVRDAMARGFAAVAVQTRHPLQALRVCLESGTRAILNHRPAPDSRGGHYTVLVDMDARDVILHDPFYGPNRRVSQAELLDLWQQRPHSEILGNLVIGIAPEPPAATPCWLCHTPFPSGIACPKCSKPVRLAPPALLGCAAPSCIARLWNAVCCPSCDGVFTFSLADAASGAPAPPPEDRVQPLKPPLDLDALFAEVDRFSAMALAIPGISENSGVMQQLDLLSGAKDKLRLAQTEAMANLAVSRERCVTLEELARQTQEAHRQKLEGLHARPGPLDGDALGRALMKNLGFIR